MNIVEKAYIFAMAAHFAVGQRRKYTGEPYIHHPVEVCDILEGAEYVNDEMRAAALLHDVVEDTAVNIGVIRTHFGHCVATLVEGLTDISKAEDGNRKVRKEIDRMHTAKQSPACKTIKLADLISNTKSIVEHDKDFARVYIKEKELLLEVLVDGDENLYKFAKELVENAKKELNVD